MFGLVLIAALSSAPPAVVPVHLGPGWLASQAAAHAEPEEPPRVAERKRAPLPVLPRIRPASTFDAIKYTRRARAFAIGSALAIEGAMIVYGIMSMIEQQKEAAASRSEFRPFNPYPR